MKKKQLFFLMQAVMLTTGTAYAEVHQQQVAQAKEYLTSKRSIQLSEKLTEGCLTLGGGVKVNYHHYSEKRPDLIPGRMAGPETANPADVFAVTAKLRLDYKADKTWASVKMNVKNTMGQPNYIDARPSTDPAHEPMVNTTSATPGQSKRYGSGSTNSIDLARAVIGATLYDENGTRLDAEIGRRHRSNYFTSKIQFDGRNDGLALMLTHELNKGGHCYLTVSPGVVEGHTRHYNLTAETGVKHVLNSGFNFSYSFSGWKKKGTDFNPNLFGDPTAVGAAVLESNPLRHRYQISQVSASYDFPAHLIKVPFSIYGGYLINHAARAETVANTTLKKNNHAGYAGLCFGSGQLLKKGDWKVDAYYAYIEGQAIPQYDALGNDTFGVGPTQNTNTGMRSGNIKGFCVKGIYHVTDAIRMEVEYQRSRIAHSNFDLQGALRSDELVLAARYRF